MVDTKGMEMLATHFTMLESCIGRMHTASQNSKQACISLVSAILGASAALQNTSLGLVAVCPIMAFWLVDAFYLSIERDFISLFREGSSDLNTVRPFQFALRHKKGAARATATLSASLSFAVWPVYTLALASVMLLRILT